MTSDQDRMIDIETKLAFQEQLLSALNDALAAQQAQLSRLETLCQSLIDRVKSLSAGAPPDAPANAQPPHY
jgi:SlyX protein